MSAAHSRALHATSLVLVWLLASCLPPPSGTDTGPVGEGSGGSGDEGGGSGDEGGGSGDEGGGSGDEGGDSGDDGASGIIDLDEAAHVTISSTVQGSELGGWLSALDYDADGQVELAVGAAEHNEVYLYSRAIDESANEEDAIKTWMVDEPEAEIYQSFGASIAPRGTDGGIVIGAPQTQLGDGLAAIGAVFFYTKSPEDSEISHEEANARVFGGGTRWYTGHSMAFLGPFLRDGEGSAVILGSYVNEEEPGMVAIVPSDISGDHIIDDLDITWWGTTGDRAGSAVAMVPDLDGDGLNEALIGAPEASDPRGDGSGSDLAGAAYLVLGGHEAASALLIDADLVLQGTGEHENFGHAVTGAIDEDGDGYGDFAVSSLGLSQVTVYRGRQQDISELEPSAEIILDDEEGSFFGFHLGNHIDMNGDDLSDWLIGAPMMNNEQSGGAIFLSLGPTSGVVDFSDEDHGGTRIETKRTDAEAGAASSSLGDVDGDGRHELVVGAPGADVEGTGMVWLFSSTSD